MKKYFYYFVTMIFACVNLTHAQVSQVVKDFEIPAKGTDDFYISSGDIATGLSQKTDVIYGGVLESQINVDSTGNAIIQVDNFNQLWTESSEGAEFLTIDVFVPEEFPDSSLIKFWESDQTHQDWKQTLYSPSNLGGGRTMVKGAWNTFLFEIKNQYQRDPEQYNPWNAAMGLEIQVFISWAGSVLIDNVTLWYTPTVLDDFEMDIDGWSNWGDVFSTPPSWIYHPDYGGVAEITVVNDSVGYLGGGVSLSNISLGWTDTTVSAVIMALDIYIPEDYPDGSYFQFYNMDQTHWNWKSSFYSTNQLNKGAWNTLTFEVLQQHAGDPANYTPWAQIQAGLTIDVDSVYAGTIYIDNLRVYSKDKLLPLSPSKLASENSVVIDFEDPEQGESGVTLGWGQEFAHINRIDHPDYGGVLEAVVSIDSSGSFAAQVSGFDNEWTNESEGPAFASVDVYIPQDFPDSSLFRIYQIDETKSQMKANFYSPSYLEGGRPMIKGAWNTFTFDIRRFAQISGAEFNPANPVSLGIEIQVEKEFSGSVYFYNFSLLGACKTEGSKDFDGTNDLKGFTPDQSVISNVQLTSTASGGILSFNILADTVESGNIELGDFNNLWSQTKGGPSLLVMDIYIPADFPDSSFFQFWEMDQTHWNWQALLYAPTSFRIAGWHRMNLIKKGAWNTICFDLRQSYQSNPLNFHPWLFTQMGFQFVMSEAWSGTIYIDNFYFVDAAAGVPTEITADENFPLEYNLAQNYPNPFNPITNINYQLPQSSRVILSVYNILGQKVATLASGKQQAGTYSVEWDASGFSSGIYYYSLKTDRGFSQTRKLVLLK